MDIELWWLLALPLFFALGWLALRSPPVEASIALSILLVAGEHPKFVSDGYLQDCLDALKPFIPTLGIEVGPMEDDQYAEIVAHGAEGLVVYQETYDREVYQTLHTAGPKKNFDWRLETPDDRRENLGDALENFQRFLGLLALASIILIGLVMVRETNRRLASTAEKNERNQAAILRLLDEIADLADGDLTVAATVTEDFTGAIADSINYSIDQLRDLVATINLTAVQVAGAAQETQATAMHLAEASEHQAQEIAGASAAINEMAVSIDQVSANASESSAVAERSVAIANKGNEVVHNTITGMDNIREQIQDTSKRIKRLGESSQEIGDIVSLINDIADQTNILALNAAIQASMAGDAGRGFAVVADEVQRLAERSSAATKQIEALVKTIQTDTNEAVISMEQTTSEVVRGARLAQDAGVALEEIEKVSKTLAALIQNISNAARQQASSAGHISNTMNVIQEITSQTSSGTTATAKSIGNLAKMASEMRKSVSGFTLPGGEQA